MFIAEWCAYPFRSICHRYGYVAVNPSGLERAWCRLKKSIRSLASARVPCHLMISEPIRFTLHSVSFMIVFDPIRSCVDVSHLDLDRSSNVVELIGWPYVGPAIEFMWLIVGRAYGKSVCRTFRHRLCGLSIGGGSEKQYKKCVDVVVAGHVSAWLNDCCALPAVTHCRRRRRRPKNQ